MVAMSSATVTVRHAHAISRRQASIAEVRAGDTVVADDGVLGLVDRVVRSEASTPVYLIVSVGRILRRRYPVVPSSLVTDVDRRRRLVRIRGRRGTIGRLPETLPLVL